MTDGNIEAIVVAVTNCATIIATWEIMKWLGRCADRAIDRWADRYVARNRPQWLKELDQ
jgi:hypothetical protein